MIFGRQNNLTRRAVRPDGSFNRSLRRRNADRVSLLDLTHGVVPRRPSLLGRVVAGVRRLIGR